MATCRYVAREEWNVDVVFQNSIADIASNDKGKSWTIDFVWIVSDLKLQL
jgi:hypothetical protein